MPTVPRYEQRVATAPLPGARLPTGVPDAAFQRPTPDLRGVESVVRSMVEDERQKADQLAVLDADRELSEAETTLLYDPKTGALNHRGKDAFALPEEVGAAWRQRVGAIEGRLTTDAQRLAFQRLSTARGVDVHRTVQRHVAGEMKSYDDEQTKSYLESERDAAIKNYQDPERIASAVERQRAALTDHARRNGLPKEWLDARLTEVTSQTHVGVIDRMLAVGDDQAASTYFGEHRADVAGADAARVEKALEEGSLRGESQRRADAILATAEDRATALARARGEITDDPKLRDLVEDRINRTFSERRQAEREHQEDLYLDSTNLVDRPESRGRNARDVVPPSTWAQLSNEQRSALQRRAENVPNDDRRWLDYLALSVSQTAGLSRAEFETRFWSRFDSSHRDRAETLWNASRDALNKAETADPKLTATLTFKDRLDNAVRTSGLVDPNRAPGKMSEREVTLYAQLEAEAAKRVEHYELTQLGGKRHATGEEMQTIIDELVTRRVFVDRPWRSDPEKPAGIITEDERGHAYVPYDRVPTADRNRLENLLRSKGQRITAERVERAYAAFLMDDKGLFDAILDGGDAP